MELKKCVICGEEKALSKFRYAFSSRDKLKSRCAACTSKKERESLKHEFFQQMGAMCACCGESDIRFLTLDHVANDGATHRLTYKSHQIYRQAKKEGYPKDRYQVLCFNCNCGRDKNKGICPHKSGITATQAWETMVEWTKGTGRKYVNTEGSKATQFKTGFDARRQQLHKRVLKKCPFCENSFGTNEMARHKREVHKLEIAKRRAECLAMGRNKE